jgi:hypothetical protein
MHEHTFNLETHRELEILDYILGAGAYLCYPPESNVNMVSSSVPFTASSHPQVSPEGLALLSSYSASPGFPFPPGSVAPPWEWCDVQGKTSGL